MWGESYQNILCKCMQLPNCVNKKKKKALLQFFFVVVVDIHYNLK